MISVRSEEREKSENFYGLAVAIDSDSDSWTVMFVVTWTWDLMERVGVCCVCVVGSSAGLLVMTEIGSHANAL